MADKRQIGRTFAQQAVAARLSRPLKEELAARVAEGQTLRQIGKALGVSHETIRVWLDEFGIGRHDNDATPGVQTPDEKQSGPGPLTLAGVRGGTGAGIGD